MLTLACMNSMDRSALLFTQTFWLDLFLFTLGAVFLNRVALANVRGSTSEGEAKPTWFRRSFFLVVAACLVLLVALVSGVAPLFGLSPDQLSECTPNFSILAVLVAVPAVLLSLQALAFQTLFSRDTTWRNALAALVSTSLLLVLVLSVVRDRVELPQLCRSPRGAAFFQENSGY
jgi:hypothetical protein